MLVIADDFSWVDSAVAIIAVSNMCQFDRILALLIKVSACNAMYFLLSGKEDINER